MFFRWIQKEHTSPNYSFDHYFDCVVIPNKIFIIHHQLSFSSFVVFIYLQNNGNFTLYLDNVFNAFTYCVHSIPIQ